MLRQMATALAVAALAALCCVVPATAAEPEDSTGAVIQPEKALTREDLLKTRTLVQSEREQRAFRRAYWVAGLTGDKKTIYDTYGYPSMRLLEEKFGQITETWTYLDGDRSFAFVGNRLAVD